MRDLKLILGWLPTLPRCGAAGEGCQNNGMDLSPGCTELVMPVSLSDILIILFFILKTALLCLIDDIVTLLMLVPSATTRLGADGQPSFLTPALSLAFLLSVCPTESLFPNCKVWESCWPTYSSVVSFSIFLKGMF